MSEIGAVISGRYRLLDRLGAGGMGTVWRADDPILGRHVALKQISLDPSLSPDERAQQRVRAIREARSLARVHHPNVVAVFDVVEHDGDPWIVMELVESVSLASAVRRSGPRSVPEMARIGIAIAAALTAAHERGVLHRDVKPANILLAHDGRVMLTDFGIATAAHEPSITVTGGVLGSPGYLAPERFDGADPNPSMDFYGLACSLFFAVEGRGPYERGDAMSTLSAVINSEPHPMLRAGSAGPVLAAMLVKDPRCRPDMARVLQTLHSLAGVTIRDESDVATTEPPPTPTLPAPSASPPMPLPHKSSGRRWKVIGVVAALSLVACIVGSFAFGGMWVANGFSRLLDSASEGTGSSSSVSPTPSAGGGPTAYKTYGNRELGYTVDLPNRDDWTVIVKTDGSRGVSAIPNDSAVRLLVTMDSPARFTNALTYARETDKSYADSYADEGYRADAPTATKVGNYSAARYTYRKRESSGPAFEVTQFLFTAVSTERSYTLLAECSDGDLSRLTPIINRFFTSFRVL